MENPLELQPPTDPIARVHEFARDLAYGATIGLWSSAFTLDLTSYADSWYSARGDDIPLQNYLDSKWNGNHPSYLILVSYGYFAQSATRENTFVLTKEAFALLDRPLKLLSVFVSYTRRESSEFSLLVEARLRLADERIDVFVDKNLVPGEEWHGALETKVRGCDYFVCLIGENTLKSEYVCKEIDWALASSCRVITILHPNLKFDDIRNLNSNSKRIFSILERKQLIVVEDKSAKHYDLAIRDLLNAMGYSTL